MAETITLPAIGNSVCLCRGLRQYLTDVVLPKTVAVIYGREPLIARITYDAF